jgi:hypothetical protein
MRWFMVKTTGSQTITFTTRSTGLGGAACPREISREVCASIGSRTYAPQTSRTRAWPGSSIRAGVTASSPSPQR